MLRPAVVPAVEQYKIDHRNEKHAITETVDDGATKEMKAVAAKDIGLSSDEYRQTAELVGLLARRDSRAGAAAEVIRLAAEQLAMR